MKYRIEISSVAEAEADGAFLPAFSISAMHHSERWVKSLKNPAQPNIVPEADGLRDLSEDAKDISSPSI